jgi:zinc D-Ala-D-Ala carboxypeptidase
MKSSILVTLSIIFACQSATPPTEVNTTAVAALEQAPAQQKTGLSFERDYLLGNFEPGTHPDFEVIGKPYSDRPGMMMRREAFESFKKMHEAALKAGISLKIISSTRTFSQQKSIWEGKWKRFAKDAPLAEARARKILEYSSMPGSSRHHWGTDIDLNDLNNPSFEGNGKHAKVYEWLSEHAHEYGFCQPYIAGRPYGYNEEKWHWSYTPISSQCLAQFEQTISDSDIKGFEGAETAQTIGIVKHYVLGIAEKCK